MKVPTQPGMPLLRSAVHPLSLRPISPHDAGPHAALLSIPLARSQELIPQQCESARAPTVLSPDGRSVLSGPSRINMVIVLHHPAGNVTTQSQGQNAMGESEEGQEERVIGLGGLGAIKALERSGGRHMRAGDVGVLLAEPYRRKGYAVEAIRLAVDWAFLPVAEGGMQLDLVTLTTLADNKPMVRLAEEKLGFKGKGVWRQAEFGDACGELYYEATPSEWKVAQAGQRSR